MKANNPTVTNWSFKNFLPEIQRLVKVCFFFFYVRLNIKRQRIKFLKYLMCPCDPSWSGFTPLEKRSNFADHAAKIRALLNHARPSSNRMNFRGAIREFRKLKRNIIHSFVLARPFSPFKISGERNLSTARQHHAPHFLLSQYILHNFFYFSLNLSQFQ